MYLFADSGSTKTVWRLVSNHETITEVMSKGINPFLQTTEEIILSVQTELLPSIEADSITKVYFYGAGCANGEKIEIVRSGLSSVFPSAEVVVFSDLLGAARSVLGKEKGIACILGTGSNSCYYDGENIVDNVSSGGYILGDEGSGAVIGKRLMADYIKNQMPAECRAILEKECNISVADVIDNVYKKPFPNRYLASYTRFIHNNLGHKYLCDIVYDSFADFFNRNIKQYAEWETMPICFVGSVAYYFRDILMQVGHEKGFAVGKIDANPIDELIQYHIKYH